MKPGQTLTVLLIFLAIAITVTTVAVGLIVTNSRTGASYEQSQQAFYAAESGMENALLRLLRNPGYPGGETLTVGPATATITLQGSNPIIVTSRGDFAPFTRTVRAEVTFTGLEMAVANWREVLP